MKLYFKSYPIIIGIGLLILIVNVWCFCSNIFIGLKFTLLAVSLLAYFLVVRFFRIPKRLISKDDNLLISPADGTISCG